MDTAPLLTTDRADRGTVVENKFVQSIPLNSAESAAAGDADAGRDHRAAMPAINTASQSTTNNFRINGGRGNTNEMLIDGAANTGTYNNQASAIPQVDAVQEFKVNTSPYAAEFGRTGGGVVSFAIKSGTQRVTTAPCTSSSATACWTPTASTPTVPGRRSRASSAISTDSRWAGPCRFPRSTTAATGRSSSSRMKGCASAVSPVHRHRTDRPRTPRRLLAERSTPAARCIRIYDPRTTRLDPDRPAGTTRYIRDVFPGNVIPAGQLNPIGPTYPVLSRAQPGGTRAKQHEQLLRRGGQLARFRPHRLPHRSADHLEASSVRALELV